MKSYLSVCLGLSIAVLSGCSTSGEKPKVNFYKTLADTTGQNGRACFYQTDVRGFGTLDHDVMSVNAGNRYYLMTFLPGCNALQVSSRAAFEGFSGEICGGGRSKVYVSDDSCNIRQVFKFNNQKEAFATLEQATKAYEAQ